jgi:hypothetical protein
LHIGSTVSKKLQTASKKVARPVSDLTGALRVTGTLSDVYYPVVWMGSREWGRIGLTTVALGLDAEGRKRVLSVRPGSIREPGLAADLLSDLANRGLNVASGLLVVTEGSKLLDEALKETWGPRVMVSHSRRQVLEDMSSHVLEAEREAVCSQVVNAWTLAPAEAAVALHRLAKGLQRSAPGAAERLIRSIDATLVVDRLGALPPLKDRLISLGTISQAVQRAHEWGGRGGGLEDLLVGLSRWLDRTRRVTGWQQLGAATRRLQQLTTGVPAPPENEDCTLHPAVQRKEKNLG